MSRHAPATRKNDSPRYIRLPAKELTVNKITDAAQAQSNRCALGSHVDQGKERDFLASGIEDKSQDDPEKPAMEGHAALPNGKYLQRMGEIKVKFVEEDIAETPTQNHPHG